MSVNVRPAQICEIGELAQIGLAAWLKGIGAHVPGAVRKRIERDNPFLPFLQEMGPAILVAVVEGKAAGLGACEHKDDLISDVWVSPDFEGRGAGSALVGALERQIASRGYSRARLEVLTGNDRAAALYRHLGYEVQWQAVKYDPILKLDLHKTGMARQLG
jgi:ribosomal-protein-alanine N-acetyltransferase